jgi:uncharacterized protein YraI
MKLILIVLFSFFTISAIAADTNVPIRLAVMPDIDACSSLGIVSGLVSNKLAVRAGPGKAFIHIDSLSNGQNLYLCGLSKDKKWHSVIYMPNQSTPDCGVSSPTKSRDAYSGPCKYGWVHSAWLKVIAG